MLMILRLARGLVTLLICLCVGLAFVPHDGARRLTALQKFLSGWIADRERADNA